MNQKELHDGKTHQIKGRNPRPANHRITTGPWRNLGRIHTWKTVCRMESWLVHRTCLSFLSMTSGNETPERPCAASLSHWSNNCFCKMTLKKSCLGVLGLAPSHTDRLKLKNEWQVRHWTSPVISVSHASLFVGLVLAWTTSPPATMKHVWKWSTASTSP